MFRIFKNIFLELLISIVNASNNTKCMSSRNHKCMIQPTFINLYPNEFLYNPFAVKLNRCVGSCNTFNDLSKYVFQIKLKI